MCVFLTSANDLNGFVPGSMSSRQSTPQQKEEEGGEEEEEEQRERFKFDNSNGDVYSEDCISAVADEEATRTNAVGKGASSLSVAAVAPLEESTIRLLSKKPAQDRNIAPPAGKEDRNTGDCPGTETSGKNLSPLRSCLHIHPSIHFHCSNASRHSIGSRTSKLVWG